MPHYLVTMKRDNISLILGILKQTHSAKLKELKQELFLKRGMTPSLVSKYLKEMEEIGLVKLDERLGRVEFTGEKGQV